MKLSTWVVMMTVFLMFLTFLGVDTGVTSILTTLGINIINSTLTGADVVSSSFWDTLIAVLAIVSGGTVIIGLFAKGYDPSLVIAPAITFIGALFAPAFISIISYVSSFNQWWATSLIVTIFGGLMIGFTMSLIDYFAGR